MRVPFIVMFGALLLSSLVLAQTNAAPTTQQAVAVGLVQRAVVRALHFDRGGTSSA